MSGLHWRQVLYPHLSPGCLHLEGCLGCGADLPPRRRMWCSDECRDDFYRSHLWQMARSRCLRAADNLCLGCGAEATEVDHITPRLGQPMSAWSCLHHADNLRALCHTCHVDRVKVFAEVPVRAAPADTTEGPRA